MDLPDLVRQYASEDTLTALSTTLGEPIQRVRAATSAAIPTLLSCYADKVSTPDGADQAFEMLHDRSPSILDRLGDSLSGSSGYSLIDEGSSQVVDLFGRDAFDGLSQAISRFSGLGLSSSRSVIGVLNSVTLATMARHSNAESGHGLAQYLGENGPAITAAIPAGLHEYLDEIPNVSGVAHHYDEGVSATGTDDEMHDEAAISRQENKHNERYYESDHSDTDRVTAGLAWVVPLLIVIAIGAALVYTLMPRTPAPTGPIAVTRPPAVPQESEVAEAQPAGATLAPEAEPLLTLRTQADPQLGRDLAQSLQQFSQTLARMKQSPGAIGSREQLQATRTNLELIRERVDKLPADQRRQVTDALRTRVPALRTSAAQATTPGDADAAGSPAAPEVEAILREIDAMARPAGQ